MSTAEDPGPDQREGLGAVIDGFMANRRTFGRAETNKYVNQAIRNEIDHAQRLKEWASDGTQPGVYQSVTAESHHLMRDEIATVMKGLRTSNAVLIEPETAEALVGLDYDGRVSKVMEVDVPSYYGTTRESRGVARGRTEVPEHISPVPLPNEPVHVSQPLEQTMAQIAERRREKYLSSGIGEEETGVSGPELG